MGLAETEQADSMVALTVKLPVFVAAWPVTVRQTTKHGSHWRRCRGVKLKRMIFPFQNQLQAFRR
jgi:hypothetical protein